MDLISVIVPVYNVEKYLRRCLDSILAQTYSNLEVIVVDDGSTDNSGVICNEYAKKDIRIQVFHQKNKGLAETRNFALKYATGKYIACVDSDDYIELDMYESLLEKMDDEIDIVTCGVNNLFPQEMYMRNYVSYKTYTCRKYNNYEAIRELFFGNIISFSSCDKLFRKSLFEGIKFPAGKVCEDLPVLYELIKKSRNVVNIGKAKYNYMYRINSISRQSFYRNKVYFAVFAGNIVKDVKLRYPKLLKEAIAWYINNVAVVLEEITNSPNRADYYDLEKRLRKLILKEIFKILKNPYISKERKQYYCYMIQNCDGYMGKFLKFII